jgi:hypothetical protein
LLAIFFLATSSGLPSSTISGRPLRPRLVV